MQVIQEEDLDFGDDYLYRYCGVPFTGTAVRIEGEERHEIGYEGGTQGGVTRSYFANGKLQEETHYRCGALHGESRSWDQDGAPISRIDYEFGIAVRWEHFAEDGSTTQCFAIEETDPQYRMLEALRRAKWASAGE